VFNHRKAKIIIVKVMIPPQIEILTLLGTSIQDDVRVGVRSILMNGDDVIKVSIIILKMLTTDSRGYISHILAACPLRIGHEHVSGVAHLWAKAIVPTA
jgi:hypothetical protein